MVLAFVAAAIAMLIAMIPAGIVLVPRRPARRAWSPTSSSPRSSSWCSRCSPQAFKRPSLFELPVLLAVLMFGSGLVFVRAMERWL